MFYNARNDDCGERSTKHHLEQRQTSPWFPLKMNTKPLTMAHVVTRGQFCRGRALHSSRTQSTGASFHASAPRSPLPPDPAPPHTVPAFGEFFPPLYWMHFFSSFTSTPLAQEPLGGSSKPMPWLRTYVCCMMASPTLKLYDPLQRHCVRLCSRL